VLPDEVVIRETRPRDRCQSERQLIPTAHRVRPGEVLAVLEGSWIAIGLSLGRVFAAARGALGCPLGSRTLLPMQEARHD
jgi:hypothetical protein